MLILMLLLDLLDHHFWLAALISKFKIPHLSKVCFCSLIWTM
jgi:hypothetical protein